MNLQQCHYLLAIKKHHSISAAAKALFVTQPSISKAIRELEKELGITILQRHQNGVSFTVAGSELLQYVQVMVDQEQSLLDHFQQPSVDHSITIASQHYSFVTAAFTKLVNQLKQSHYVLTLEEGRATDVINQVAQGAAVIGVLGIASLNSRVLEQRFRSAKINFQALFTGPLQIFVRRDHPLTKYQRISPQQLQKFPNLTYRQDDPTLSLVEGSVRPRLTNQTIFLNDRATMDSMLLHTNGYNIGTGLTEPAFIDPDVTAIPLDTNEQLSIGILTRTGHQLGPDLQDFVHNLAEDLRH